MRRFFDKSSRRGFSLVELLAVIAIISILTAVTTFSIGGVASSGSLTQNASNLGDLFAQARSYAMSNNTYVYIGMQETNASQPGTAGAGEIVVSVVAAQGGDRPFQSTPAQLSATDVVPIAKLQRFSNIHITSALTLTNGNMSVRPSATTVGFVDLSADTSTSTVGFQWPLTGTPQFVFTKVIEFDPEGVARVQTKGMIDSAIPSYIELPLLPTHGTAIAANSSNEAAIQIDGMTGIIRMYRP